MSLIPPLSVTQYEHFSLLLGAVLSWADPEGGAGGPDPLENHKNIVF